MQLYLLRTFVTVAEHGHLTKAATLLHVTQPAVSGQLKALEESLGLKLFERSPTGVRLTKAGAALLPKAKATLAAAAEFSLGAKQLSGQVTGKARVGTILDPEVIRLADFTNALLGRHPWFDMELAHGISTWAMECVSNGTLDAAFFMGSGFHSNVRDVQLEELTYYCVAPPGWKERIERGGWTEVAALPWIRPPRQSPHQHMQEELFAPQRLNPATIIEADQEASISTLVKSGIGIGLMRSDLADAAELSGQVFVWRNATARTTLSFVYARGREKDPSILALLDAVNDAWHGARAGAPRALRTVA